MGRRARRAILIGQATNVDRSHLQQTHTKPSARVKFRFFKGLLKIRTYALLSLFVFLSGQARADVISCVSGASCTTTAAGISSTGTFAIPEDVFLESFTLAANTTVTVQTYGFGGGTNAAGSLIPSGGFDSLVALFSGPPTSASILMSGGNSIASAPGTTQFFPGCPPAGNVTIGTELVCADNTLTATLAAGDYTLLLSDADYQPIAFNPGDSSPQDLTSANSYTDLTAGVFQTCNDQGDCITPNGNFAVDLLFAAASPVSEPGSLLLLGSGLVALVWQTTRRSRRRPD
jgi:hypothetical protein